MGAPQPGARALRQQVQVRDPVAQAPRCAAAPGRAPVFTHNCSAAELKHLPSPRASPHPPGRRCAARAAPAACGAGPGRRPDGGQRLRDGQHVVQHCVHDGHDCHRHDAQVSGREPGAQAPHRLHLARLHALPGRQRCVPCPRRCIQGPCMCGWLAGWARARVLPRPARWPSHACPDPRRPLLLPPWQWPATSTWPAR